MTVAAVALLVLTVAARAANADARTSIVSGFDDLEDLAPPGSTTCLKWHDVLEETNEALRRCELSSSRDFDEAASTTTAALPPPVPFRAEPTLVDLNDNRATSLQDGTGQPLRQTAATSTGDADAMEPSSRDLLHTSTYDDLLNDPKTRDIIDGYDGASRPHWVVHPESHEERTAHLLRHVDKKGRRLQDDGNLAAALLDGDDGTIGCTDPLASNDGALGTSCTYSCAALEQEYFPGQPARCFLYDPSTQTWPAELLAMRQQRLEVHTYIDQVAGANPAADTALAFTVGSGRSCQNVTITSSMMAPQTTRTEVVCLVDGEHEYNHTITDEHSVEVVGYADSGVHTGAGGTTSFVVGECTDVLIRVTTIAAGSAGGSPITWSIDDGGHNGPWTFDSAGGAGVHEYASCMFDNDFTLTREPSASSWQGSVEVVGFIQYHNTITIPNNENWIVQGNVDPATGLPVSLDARLSSGTPLDRSHANIALRYVRFTGHFAPAEVSPQLVGYGGWWTPGTYGGAFRYEGGSSDPANLVRLTFDHVIYDHNGATVGGAMLINGRAGAAIDGASTQNWESGIAATWVSCMFYRNFAEFSVPGVMVSNVWPMAISWNNSAFIENSCDLVGSVVCVDNWYIWDALTVQGPDRRVGSATLVQMDTLVDGGWSTEGLVTSVMSSGMMFQVDGSSPSEPDAVWNVTISGATYRNVKTLLHPVPLWFGVFPPNARNQFEMNVLVSDVTVTDCTATVPHIYDALYFVADYCNFLVERTRFERNGYFNDDAMGFGGCHSLAVPNLPAGEARPRLVYVNTEWIGNAAGYGAALYIVDEFVFVVDQCLFRENIARKGGAAIYFKGALNTELIVSRSVFEMNAVRPPQSGEKNAPATVVAFTDTLAEGEQRAFVWRIDDGPVRGIGWDYCQDVMERSQWSVQHGYPPSWPSTLPSSCSNETYSVFTTYSTTEMLTPGDHTLWHGTVTTSAMSVELSHSSWIKVDGVTPPIFPNFADYRGERFPGCVHALACTGPRCCPINEVMWSSTQFRVSVGRGGAVEAAGSNFVTIRDCVFTDNEAPGGATLRLSSTLSARITNSSIEEPTNEHSSAVSAFGAAVATCFSNPCHPGSRCTFSDHSTFCEACGPNEISEEGVSCRACPPGTGPNGNKTQCMECGPSRYSSIGICLFCGASTTSSADRTGCVPCQPGTRRGGADEACVQCPVGTQSSDGVMCGTCPAGASPTVARDGCTTCEAGKHSADGIHCTLCEAGTQPSASLTGCDSCTLSGPNAFSPDGAACRDCPARNAPNYERTECACQVDSYSTVELGSITCHGTSFRSDGMETDECAVCPSCMDCTVVGTTMLKSGWAFFGAGEAYPCPGAGKFEACPALLLDTNTTMDSSTCAMGYEGPVCGNCQPKYNHLKVGNPCDGCDDNVVNLPLIFGMMLGGAVIGGAVVSGAMGVLSDYGVITDLRILVGFYQILGQSTNVLDLTFPYPIPEMMGYIKLLFLDVRSLVKLDCMSIGGFYGKITTNVVVVPLAVIGLCFLIFEAQRRTLAAVIAAGAADASAYEPLKVKLKHNLFLGIFLVYPTVTTTLFRVAQCKDFGDASFHEDDYNIDCNTTKFMLIQAFAFFVIILIPIGIPTAFAFLMWRAKQALGGVVYETATGGAKLSTDDVDEEADAYGFLTGDYRPDCYYYEIVSYSKKLVLSGVSVMVGRGTLAQIYFVITAEAFYLMHHVRTFPFVNYKHNLIEALGHQALLLMYAIALILRGREDSDDIWLDEWFPKEGYGWFLGFVSAVVLPAPTVYFYYKDTHSVTGTRWTNASTTAGSDDNFQENPLAMESDQSDAYDIEGRELPNAPPAQVKLAKMQREAKDTRAQNQKMQTQLLQLQTDAIAKDNTIATLKDEAATQKDSEIAKDNEIASLKAITTAKDESTKVQALQNEIVTLKAQATARRPQMRSMELVGLDNTPATEALQQPAPAKLSAEAMKEHATDESLSEQTRESAKEALDELAAAQIFDLRADTAAQIENKQNENANLALAGKNAAHTRKLAIASEVVSEDMAKFLQGHRLLHYADAVIRVAGMDAVPCDLQHLTGENIEEVAGAMTQIEKIRFQAAMQALREDQADVVEIEAE